MAKIPGWTEESDQKLAEWIATRPQIIKDMIQRWPPSVIYRHKVTGQRGFITAWSENGTITMGFPQQWNPSQLDGREVFGINPAHLEEGALLKKGEIDDGDPELAVEREQRCHDCKLDTVEINENYMVRDKVWKKAIAENSVRFLCIGCLESRLGRTLNKQDFTQALCNMIPPRSQRLLDRLSSE